MRHQGGSHARVIVDDLSFGETGGGIEDLIEVRKGERLALDFDGLRIAHWVRTILTASLDARLDEREMGRVLRLCVKSIGKA